MKRYLKFLFSFVLSVGLMISPVLQVVSYADVNDLLINTSSNAMRTFAMTRSSVASVTNTIDWTGAQVRLGVFDGTYTNYVYMSITDHDQDGASFRYSLDGTAYNDSKYCIVSIGVVLDQDNLPYSRDYLFNWDVTSQFSYDVKDSWLWSRKDIANAQSEPLTVSLNDYVVESSGDYAVLNYGMKLTSVDKLMSYYFISSVDHIRSVDIYTKISFVPSSGDYEATAGGGTSDLEYQSGVSSSLSDLSSSVDTMTDEISGVTEAIQNLQGAMEPHYSNVLTQLHHITEQLHAFYDQVYNNIHLPELDMLTQIKTAIENIDLQIEVDISEVKTAINNMSTAVQNKLQSTTDQITGGYDNSGMSSDKTELDGVLDQYEQAEEQLFDDAKGHINDFEFNTPLDSFTGPLADVSYFLNGMFEAMGPMNVVISFSLTLTIAMVMIGWYRFKGGR